MLMRDAGDGADVGQAQCRIAGRLDPDELRLTGTDELGNVKFDAGRKSDLYAMSGGNLRKIAMCPAIDV